MKSDAHRGFLSAVQNSKKHREKHPPNRRFLCCGYACAEKPFHLATSLYAPTHIIKTHYRQTKSVNSGGAASSRAFSEMFIKCKFMGTTHRNPLLSGSLLSFGMRSALRVFKV